MRLLLFVILLALPSRGAQETELKDADGKTIIRYVIEVPAGIAAAAMPKRRKSRRMELKWVIRLPSPAGKL